MRASTWVVATLVVAGAAGAAHGCILDYRDECLEDDSCGGPRAGAGPGGSAAGGGTGGATGGGGAGGTGGQDPCGGACADPTPLCDESTNTCVACLGSDDCTDPAAARCEVGACVACQGPADCTHLPGLGVCDAGTCVECALGDESACAGPETCDLLANTCTGPAEGTVLNCRACTNDLQCEAGHRCIAMDFEGSPHGHYCLREPPPNCARPFLVFINKPSLSGAPATDYCGVDEDLVSCEAVVALQSGWVCSGTDGMCGPDGEPEVPVPGALCRQVGAGPNQCTYECAGALDCLSAGAGSTCGGGPPSWCGG